MTSLELIKEEIKRLKDILESDYVRDVPYLRDTQYTTWANDRLQTLEQIKLELEAWEIAKAKEVDILDVKTSLDLETFNLDLVKAYQLTDYEYEILKKALEVSNNGKL